MAKASWTEEQVGILKKLWGAREMSCSRIAAALGGGLTKNAVIGKIQRLGLPHRREAWPRRTKAATIADNRLKMRLNVGSVGAPQKVAVEPRREPDVAEPVSKRLTLLELTPNACRYIADETLPYTYCAHDAKPGSPWCEFHYGVCVHVVSASEANRRAAMAANYR